MMNRFWKRVLFSLMLLSLFVDANDGAYTLSGNQLVPMKESNISIKKEVLTITRLDDDTLDVKVEYTFFNPNKAKKVLVGFEAAEPDGDVTTKPVNGGHPYMKRFSVLMNGKKLDYKVKHISSDYEEGKMTVGYVYSFEALFKKGINSVTHHYSYESSGGVSTHYEIDYILSAASRWANGLIEDFTLIIDVGDMEQFTIAKTFFTKASEWEFDGMSKSIVIDPGTDFGYKALRFFLYKSPLVFKKKNFKIKGELNLNSWRIGGIGSSWLEAFDYRVHRLSFQVNAVSITNKFHDKTSYKILKNIAYARRGYVFKNPTIQKYFEQYEWYRKNPKYKAFKSHLSIDEKGYLEILNEESMKILKNLPYAKRGYVFKSYVLKPYFESQKWYKKEPKYKANFSSLPLVEQQWIRKIKAMKESDDVDFFRLLYEYNKLYNGCLHKSEKKEIEKFVLILSVLRGMDFSP